MARSSSSAKKGSARKGGAAANAKNLRGNAGRAKQAAPAPGPVDQDGSMRDIAGVALGVVAVASFIAVVSPSSAPVTQMISQFYHLGFGLGAYVLPLVILAAAVCLFLRDRSPVSGRTAAGAALVFVCVLALLSLSVPYTSLSTAGMFEQEALRDYGGYTGAFVASFLQQAFGKSIARVILVGAIIGGFVIIGFSISDFVQGVLGKVQELRARHRVEVNERPWGEADVQGEGRGHVPFGDAGPGKPEAAETSYLGARETTVIDRSDAVDVDEDPIVDLSEQLAAERAKTVLIPVPERYSDQMARADETPAAPAVPQDEGDATPASVHARAPEEPDGPAWNGPFVAFGVDDEPDAPGPIGHARATTLIDLNDDAPVEAGVPEPEAAPAAALEDGPAASAAPAADAVDKTVAVGQIPDFLLARGDTVAYPAKAVSLVETDEEQDTGAAAPSDGAVAPGRAKPSARAKKVAAPAPAGASGDAPRALPPISMLRHNPNSASAASSERELEQTAEALQATLAEFNLHAKVVGWISGPTVTTFKVQPGEGERVSRISSLEDDIALSLAAQSVRIFAPIAGTSLVGIEIPNQKRQNVNLADVLPYVQGGPLELAIGRDAEGNPVVADLAKMPHLLIAGTTGSGKSVMINSIVMTLLMRTFPEDVRLIMVDPKRVELAGYNGLPHLYVPVVTEPKQAASALQWAVSEMERRLKVFERLSVRKISTFNEKQAAGAFEHYDNPPAKMPYLVIIIDELSDLMMVVGKDVEASIVRIAQLGRAAGIHLIVATQRPSSNVVTGLIKANITNRIAFNVATGVDSRVIIDQVGAEKLTGLGDMLFSKVGWGKPKRIQGCFVSDDEIAQVVEFVQGQGGTDYHEEILSAVAPAAVSGSGGAAEPAEDDPLLWNAAHIVVDSQLGSTSGLQRRLKVGYARAGRIMDMLEEKGIVGPPDGSKPREVLLDEEGLAALEALEGPLTREEVEGF